MTEEEAMKRLDECKSAEEVETLMREYNEPFKARISEMVFKAMILFTKMDKKEGMSILKKAADYELEYNLHPFEAVTEYLERLDPSEYDKKILLISWRNCSSAKLGYDRSQMRAQQVSKKIE